MTTTRGSIRAVMPYSYKEDGERRWGVVVVLANPDRTITEDGFWKKDLATNAGFAMGRFKTGEAK